MVSVFYFLGTICVACLAGLLWDLRELRRDNADLRAQNERLISRIGHDYHFTTSRPGPPPPIIIPPSAPPPMFSYKDTP